ncbi:unnamed protein product, partial [Musa textilis]
VNGIQKRFGAVGQFPPCQRKPRKVWGKLSAAAATERMVPQLCGRRRQLLHSQALTAFQIRSKRF